ncbi:hypothetical protein INR49_011717 [Caranx melampygus]|nr:hypothetical protein INR49_011717 [Caranx melampygus]
MSPLYMDTGYDDNSPGSLSAEDCNSNTAGSEREGEGQQVGGSGRRRREKNRDAARRTRRKQTERADQLHEELQGLERTNSALQKEITGLKKELHHYTTALAHHEPYCRHRASDSISSSTSRLSASPSAKRRTSTSPPKDAPQTSSSTLVTPPSVSISFTSSLRLQTLDSVENAHLLSSTLPSSSGSPAELVSPSSSSSSPVTVPYSVSFSALPAPHSLFSKEPPITSALTNVTPVCTSLVSSCNFSSALTTAAPTGQNTTHKTSVAPNALFNALHSDTLEEFLTASSGVVPPYSHVNGENENLLAQGCPSNVPQLHAGQYNGNPNDLNLLSPSTPQDPAFQPFTVLPQANLHPPPPPAFALKPNYRQQMAPNSVPMLSLLTVPSPLNITCTTSNSTDRLICHPPPSLPLSGDPMNDLSLSELLEVNDWILSGSGDQ